MDMNIARPQVSTMTQVPHVYYNQALELARSGSLADARDKLAAVLTLEPESVDAHVVHGKVHAQMEQYDWAIGCWTRALELDPENAAAQAGIARARQLLQRQRTARRLWLAARVTCVAAVFLLGAWVVRPYQAAMARRAIVPPEPIQAALRRSPSLRSASLTVVSGPGAVALQGEVATESQRELARSLTEQEARGFPVSVEGVRVRHPDPLAESLRNWLSQLGDPAFRLVAVSQSGDRLALAGVVPTAQDRRRLEAMAKALVGVRSVEASKLRVEGVVEYVVQDGDTPWSLAKRFYDDGREWGRIVAANRAVIRDSRKIRVGTKLTIPPPVEGQEKEGDTR